MKVAWSEVTTKHKRHAVSEMHPRAIVRLADVMKEPGQQDILVITAAGEQEVIDGQGVPAVVWAESLKQSPA